jgi:hypothetical protein
MARGENQKAIGRRPARPRAKRPRYWPYRVPGRGVPAPARVETQGGSCAGNTVHSVPGGAIGAAESISRKNCGSGSGSPQNRRSACIETDRFAYLSHSQPAREASLYILTKHSALQNVSHGLADRRPKPGAAPSARATCKAGGTRANVRDLALECEDPYPQNEDPHS